MVLLLSGCSIALQKKPVGVHASECSTSIVYPVIDTALTAVAVAASIYGFSRVDKTGDAIGAPTGFIAIPLLASGVNGFRDASTCGAHEQPIAAR